jgi:putative transposase
VILGHRIRLVPTADQEVYFKKACGTARFSYNWALAQWQQRYKAGEHPSEAALRRELNAIKDERRSSTSQIESTSSLHRQDEAAGPEVT